MLQLPLTDSLTAAERQNVHGPGKRIFLSPPHMCGEEMKFVQEAFASNYIAPVGPQLDAFEREFCELVGIPHAVALSSGTAAMHLALRLLDIGPGDTVIAPSLTFVGGVNPAIYQGGELAFIDSERISWNIDPTLVEEELAFRSRQGKLPKAVISADIYGQCADMEMLLAICASYDVPLVSDSAEALGATWRGLSAGVGAKAAIYSFNGNKIITTSGGGMLASPDEQFIEKARFLSEQARDHAPHYEHSQIGYNYRMSNISAAIGRGQLRRLGERVEIKRRIFDNYEKAFADVAGIEFMPEARYGRSSRWLSVVLIEPKEFGADRERVRIALEKENIESRAVWKPMHLQPVFKGSSMRGGKVCEDFFQRGLCLPSGTAMSDEDLEKVVETILSVRPKKVAQQAVKTEVKSIYAGRFEPLVAEGGI